MLRKNQGTREQMEIFVLEDMVPENHLLRQTDAAIEFNRIMSSWRICTVRTMVVRV